MSCGTRSDSYETSASPSRTGRLTSYVQIVAGQVSRDRKHIISGEIIVINRDKR